MQGQRRVRLFLPTKDTLQQLLLSHCKLRTAINFRNTLGDLQKIRLWGVAFKMGAHICFKNCEVSKKKTSQLANRRFEKTICHRHCWNILRTQHTATVYWLHATPAATSNTFLHCSPTCEPCQHRGVLPSQHSTSFETSPTPVMSQREKSTCSDGNCLIRTPAMSIKNPFFRRVCCRLAVKLGSYFVRSLAFHLKSGVWQNRGPNGDALRGHFWDVLILLEKYWEITNSWQEKWGQTSCRPLWLTLVSQKLPMEITRGFESLGQKFNVSWNTGRHDFIPAAMPTSQFQARACWNN